MKEELEAVEAQRYAFLNLQVDAINFDDLANRIVQRFADAVNAELCTLWRRVPGEGGDLLVLSASSGFERHPGEEIPTYPIDWTATENENIPGLTAWIAIRNQLCVADSYDDLARNPSRPWYGAHRGTWDNLLFMQGTPQTSFRSLLGIPLTHDDKPMAVLKAENSRRADGFTDADVRLATALAPLLAVTLETANRREQNEQHRQEVLRDLTSALATLELPIFYQQVVERTAQLLSADVCSLWLVEEPNRLVLAANYGVYKSAHVPQYELAPEPVDDKDIGGLTAWVAIRKRPFFAKKYEDFRKCEAHRGKWDRVQWEGSPEARFGCLYAVPLLRGGEAIGVLKIENARGKRIFDDVERATFDVMANSIAVAIELSRRLQFDVVFDFFHNLVAPTNTAVSAYRALRSELERDDVRAHRVRQNLDILGNRLSAIGGWTRNLAAVAPAENVGREPPQKITLRTLLTEVVEDIRKLETRFECRISSDADELAIALNDQQKKKVEFIFFNLLDNAYKYSADPRDIRIHASLADRGISIVVKDNGRGIRKEDLSKVFLRGFRATNAAEQTGIGFGLSTVARLVSELGWRIEARSEGVGRGTEMALSVPMQEVPG